MSGGSSAGGMDDNDAFNDIAPDYGDQFGWADDPFAGSGDAESKDYAPQKSKWGSKVSWEDSDIEALGEFQTDSVPQHLIDKGLITPFEFKIPELGTARPGYTPITDFETGRPINKEDPYYLSPSQFKATTGLDYDSDRGFHKGGSAVKNWIAEMNAQRSNQYAEWKTDYGHFLGSAGTRLASRFDQEEAKLSKKTLLAGGQG